jgi:hypothetical protein
VGDIDQAARWGEKQLDAEGFLRWVVPGAFTAWRWAGWLDTRTVAFPGEPDRTCDTVALFERLAHDEPPAAVVLEAEARPGSDKLERLAEYVLRLRRELPYQRDPLVRYQVVGVLLNLTGPAQGDTWVMEPADFGNLGLRFRAGVLTLREVDAAKLLAAIEAKEVASCLLAWVPLMAGAESGELVEEWKRLASAEPDLRRRSEYGALARVFADLAGRLDVWRTGLEGWNVERSRVADEWRGEARRRDLLRVLEVRFPGGLPADLVASVSAQSDLDMLTRWFDQALTATTLEEVRTALGLS